MQLGQHSAHVIPISRVHSNEQEKSSDFLPPPPFLSPLIRATNKDYVFPVVTPSTFSTFRSSENRGKCDPEGVVHTFFFI